MQYILVISENRSLLESLASAFDDKEAQLDLAVSFSAANELSSNRQYDAALLDTPQFDADASQFLAKFLEHNPQTIVIPISPDATVNQVTAAMRSGAADFIHEPTGPAEILARIENSIQKRRMKNEIDFLRRTQPVIYRFDDIVGDSAAMK
jgi:two-component system response regulator HydG